MRFFLNTTLNVVPLASNITSTDSNQSGLILNWVDTNLSLRHLKDIMQASSKWNSPPSLRVCTRDVQSRKVSYEPLVEISMLEETTNSFHKQWRLQFLYHFNLCFVNLLSFLQNFMPKHSILFNHEVIFS